MDNIFLYSTEIIILSLFFGYNRYDLNKFCNSVLDISRLIYNYNLTSDNAALDFKGVVDDYIEAIKHLPNGSNRIDYVELGIGLVCSFLNKNTDIVWPKFNLVSTEDEERAWNNVEAPFIWEWIHVVTIHIDINAGVYEKISFINFIQNVITCGLCKYHYQSNIQLMVQGLQKQSLTDTYLILHSCIAAKLPYDSDKTFLIEKDKKEKFFRQYMLYYNNNNK